MREVAVPPGGGGRGGRGCAGEVIPEAEPAAVEYSEDEERRGEAPAKMRASACAPAIWIRDANK